MALCDGTLHEGILAPAKGPRAAGRRCDFTNLLVSVAVLSLAAAAPAADEPVAAPGAKALNLIEVTQSTNAVGVYDYLEVTVRPGQPVGANPFVDAAVEGEFGLAKGRAALKVDGFCDSQDGSIYRLRFMPSQAGEYRYKVTLRHAGKAASHDGTFTARDAKRRGQLRVDPQYPEHFLYAGTGEHYFWNGTTTYYLMGWEDDAVIRQAIDRLAALKVNRLRVLVYGRNEDRPWGQPVKTTPDFKLYLNPWPAARPDDVRNPAFDLKRFNVAFWQKYERMLCHARERDVMVSAICLAEPGVVYALYLPSPMQMTVKLAGANSYRARWFNPRTGHWIKLPEEATGPQWTSPKPPGDGDWALLLTTCEQLHPPSEKP